MEQLFFSTTNLHKHNTEKKFPKQTYNRILHDISRSDMGNEKKFKKNSIYMYT